MDRLASHAPRQSEDEPSRRDHGAAVMDAEVRLLADELAKFGTLPATISPDGSMRTSGARARLTARCAKASRRGVWSSSPAISSNWPERPAGAAVVMAEKRQR